MSRFEKDPFGFSPENNKCEDESIVKKDESIVKKDEFICDNKTKIDLIIEEVGGI